MITSALWYNSSHSRSETIQLLYWSFTCLGSLLFISTLFLWCRVYTLLTMVRDAAEWPKKFRRQDADADKTAFPKFSNPTGSAAQVFPASFPWGFPDKHLQQRQMLCHVQCKEGPLDPPKSRVSPETRIHSFTTTVGTNPGVPRLLP